jgi:peptide/nickel transport system substrate-binding protein
MNSILPRFTGALAVAILLAGGACWGSTTMPYREARELTARVKSGALPPVRERLPAEPAFAQIETYGGRVGRFGGDWRMLVYRAKDVRMILIFGYARLVGFNRYYKLEPDILKSYEVKEGRIFTFTLRRGHKWSDGHPFTTEDFRYYWEDVATNRQLFPSGPPQIMLVEGEPPEFEVLSDTMVRYTWKGPNPYFLHALARPLPLTIFQPSHYLKNFHAKYADKEHLEHLVKTFKRPNWGRLNHKMNDYRNPIRPTLQPWVNTTAQPATRFIGLRNPYYHRVDRLGHQLPYIDRLIISLTDSRLVSAKSGAGDADLQARGLDFKDYTFLKMGEKRNNFTVRLWREARGSHLALYPNLNVNDPVWRKLMRDVRFRRALSLAINRHELNQVLFYGLVQEGNNTVLPDSPLYEESYRRKWARFDLEAANRLLDEVGLPRAGPRGLRVLPDGRPLEIIVETAGESPLQSDVLQLIVDSWAQAGIKLFTKPSQREVFRRRVFAGESQMSIWFGLENGLATPESDPWELAPTAQISLQWPKWGKFYESGGRAGEPADMEEGKELLALYHDWQRAHNNLERHAAWKRMLDIHRDQVFTIGLVGEMFQPVVVSNRLANVPEKGIYNWDPGSFFGIYRPDTFWFTDSQPAAVGGANGTR